jgi:hypothetical protein
MRRREEHRDSPGTETQTKITTGTLILKHSEKRKIKNFIFFRKLNSN